MSNFQASATETPNPRDGQNLDVVNTTTAHSLGGDAQILQANLQAYLNSFPITEIHSHERKARIMYHTINWFINLLLISQAVLSAVLVAAGAMETKHQKAIVTLGALNGVVTSILAIIKGQGLPGRYYQYASGLREVMRKFGNLNRKMVANREITRQECDELNKDYEKVEKENDRNTPDILSTGSSSRQAD
ncbi:hypothetical protein B0J11DRAFT_582081 [Dendryphion nanum]|uniref:SMODS and SLOG-associating 2TM effector domain-containing protein n=1 Tax=Dendryphion nanum TaxID=256645 RepID=A0A9P9IF51_9PLEO|nr:hypothetical protein B0J11DRAFT_508365 [Dendryphion nanum]KAH7119553.1 hypothetical protein B0J11DRAFT_582081 [Dendryphion nanum]